LKLAGACFFVGVRTHEEAVTHFGYAVTARHVIESIKSKSTDGRVYLRTNLLGSVPEPIPSELGDWRFHPSDSTVDVAVILGGIPVEHDHLLIPTSTFATDEIVAREEIGLGEEVFLVGLFSEHIGKKRNTPIVRVGNIAAMPEEPVQTPSLGPIEAYLVEARSIGGLSGSPVFVHLGLVRVKEGRPIFARAKTGVFYLLGLMHGHWDRKVPDIDSAVDDVIHETVNMGIAVVVPAKKILEVIDQPELSDERKRIEEERSKTRGESKSPTTSQTIASRRRESAIGQP